MGSEELERLHQEIESLRAEVRQLRESTAKFVNGSVARDSKAQPEESRPGKGLAGELEEIEHEPERFKSFIREHPYYVAILLVIACAVAGGIYAAWRYLESYEVTSDARVVGDISPISSQVPGTVTKVLVNNDQRVQAGQRSFSSTPANINCSSIAHARCATARARPPKLPVRRTRRPRPKLTAAYGHLTGHALDAARDMATAARQAMDAKIAAEHAADAALSRRS
jgi:membrane fusion protein, multidrug efflux system